jgi:predicted SnoaL-like aldol condensation-catalyzing enzyme
MEGVTLSARATQTWLDTGSVPALPAAGVALDFPLYPGTFHGFGDGSGRCGEPAELRAVLGRHSPSRNHRDDAPQSSTCYHPSTVTGKVVNVSTDEERRNKEFVLEAFDTLFNKRDYVAAQRFWSPNYIQHSAHIGPGRDGLFALIEAAPAELTYENAVTVADGDYVILHGRFSNTGQPANWVAADVVRLQDGLLAEHWDVLQDEATEAQSLSGLPMFGDQFPTPGHI